MHAHDWTVATQTFYESENLSSFYNLLAVDTHGDIEFVIAIEAFDYPIAGVMTHPETQNMRVFEGGD